MRGVHLLLQQRERRRGEALGGICHFSDEGDAAFFMQTGDVYKRQGKDYPSNAFAILTGNGGLHVATQCGVFKGTTKAVFVDRREYTGPVSYTHLEATSELAEKEGVE